MEAMLGPDEVAEERESSILFLDCRAQFEEVTVHIEGAIQGV